MMKMKFKLVGIHDYTKGHVILTYENKFGQIHQEIKKIGDNNEI